jgi:hypothetical protein
VLFGICCMHEIVLIFIFCLSKMDRSFKWRFWSC